MINAQQFVNDYQEFNDSAVYSPQLINYWLHVAGLLIRQRVVGPSGKKVWPTNPPYPALTIYDVLCELFVAHNIALEGKAIETANNGGSPGSSSGPIASKSVDKVSVSYNTSASMELDAGHWNLTIYGQRYIRLARMFGNRPIQVNVGVNPGYTTGPGPWPGPFYGP